MQNIVVVLLYYNFMTKNVNKADKFSTFIWIYYNGKILRYIIIIGIRVCGILDNVGKLILM